MKGEIEIDYRSHGLSYSLRRVVILYNRYMLSIIRQNTFTNYSFRAFIRVLSLYLCENVRCGVFLATAQTTLTQPCQLFIDGAV